MARAMPLGDGGMLGIKRLRIRDSLPRKNQQRTSRTLIGVECTCRIASDVKLVALPSLIRAEPLAVVLGCGRGLSAFRTGTWAGQVRRLMAEQGAGAHHLQAAEQLVDEFDAYVLGSPITAALKSENVASMPWSGELARSSWRPASGHRWRDLQELAADGPSTIGNRQPTQRRRQRQPADEPHHVVA